MQVRAGGVEEVTFRRKREGTRARAGEEGALLAGERRAGLGRPGGSGAAARAQ